MPQTHEEKVEKSVATLKELVLNTILQTPWLSLQIINDKKNAVFGWNDFLLTNTAFIKLLPRELKYEIILNLPLENWSSLFKVSKEWKQAIIDVANHYLNTVDLDKVVDLDFNALTEGLLKKIKTSYARTGRRVEEVRELERMGGTIYSLQTPLAKLFWLKQGLIKVERKIKDDNGFRFTFLRVNNSVLHRLISPTLTQCKLLTQTPCFQKTLQCAEFVPEHPNAQVIAKAHLEISLVKTVAAMERSLQVLPNP